MRVKTICVEITDICNLNCRTCYNRSGVNRARHEISKSQLEDIIQIFSQYGLNRFLISGGEPTLHSEFDRLLNLPELYPNISFGAVTNGTNYNEKLVRLINNSDSFTLQISLDGSCEDVNTRTRGEGNFEKTLRFLNSIHSSKMKPLLKMVISQNNYDDISAFYEFALSRNFVPEYAFIYRSGNGTDEWEHKALTTQQRMRALKLIESLNGTHNTKAFFPLCTTSCPYTRNHEEMSLCVKTNGDIQPCQSLYSSEYCLGNVWSFDEGQFERRLNEISAIAKQRAAMDFNCGKCIINECCGRGCMAMAVFLHNDPLADDGDCAFRKIQFIEHNIKGRFINQ